MAADYYDADAENGDHIADPSEDALVMLLQNLDPDGNTFITINPADDSGWYASVTLLDHGNYEVERRDPDRHQHDLNTGTDIAAIAKDLGLAGQPRIPRTTNQPRLTSETRPSSLATRVAGAMSWGTFHRTHASVTMSRARRAAPETGSSTSLVKSLYPISAVSASTTVAYSANGSSAGAITPTVAASDVQSSTGVPGLRCAS
jgi:hypothetical protein